MVKLASVRPTRMYGPRGSETAFEFLNAWVYTVATVLLLAGFILFIPAFNYWPGLIVLSIAMVLIMLINLHDLYAQLRGIEYQLGQLAAHTEVALVDVSVPFLYTVGSVLFLIALILTIERVGCRRQMRLMIAGISLWFVGSVLNAFQVYDIVSEYSSTRTQLHRKGIYLAVLMASMLLLVGSIFWFDSWPQLQDGAAILGITASALLVIASVVNIDCILHLRRLEALQVASSSSTIARRGRGSGGSEAECQEAAGATKEPLLGGAYEPSAEHGRVANAETEPAAGVTAAAARSSIASEGGHPTYKEVVL